MSWALVVGRYAEDAARGAIEVLTAADGAPRVITAADRGELVTRARDAVADGHPLMVVGGDGTINAVVEGALGAGVPTPTLAVLPAGTGSDFARMFALPVDPATAVTRALHGQDYAVDVGVVEGPWGRRVVVNEAEAGIGGATTRLAERLPRSWGPRKYELAFWGAVGGFTPGPARLVTDRREFELERGAVVVAANGEYFGGGMRIAPKASVVDGKWDLIVMEGRRAKAVSLFPKMKHGLHLSDRAVRRIVTASFRLETERPWPVEIDGDHVGDTPLEGWIEPGAFLLRV
ncbi:MAG: diacylglycerol kinase family protein [Acidimicrobiia bacterium]